MKIEAQAKVNLHLRVLAREESGYHQLETVFCALELSDIIEIVPADPGLRLLVHGPDLGPAEDNLVVRAATAFYDAIGREPRLDIALHKSIPAGAGLGGGSSDAAAVLRALDSLHNNALPQATLLDIARALGSDVPFFMTGHPLALAWGRGERLLQLPPLPRTPIVVAAPAYGMSTPEAYAALAAERARNPHTAAPTLHNFADFSAWARVADNAQNDFEAVVFELLPQLAEIRTAFLDCGALFSLLAGSGSAVFGVFEEDGLAERAAPELERRFPGVRALITHTAS